MTERNSANASSAPGSGPSGASPGRLNRLRTLGRRVRTVHQVHWVLPWPTDPAPHVGATGHDGPQVHWEGAGSRRSAKANGVPPNVGCRSYKRHRCTAVTDRPSSRRGQPRDLYRSGPPLSQVGPTVHDGPCVRGPSVRGP